MKVWSVVLRTAFFPEKKETGSKRVAFYSDFKFLGVYHKDISCDYRRCLPVMDAFSLDKILVQ